MGHLDRRLRLGGLAALALLLGTCFFLESTNPVSSATTVSIQDAMARTYEDSGRTVRGYVRRLHGPTACGGYKGVNPYINPEPGPQAGKEWRCAFVTSACPNPDEPDWDSWIVISHRKLKEPISFEPYGMPGCWLHLHLDQVVFVPSGVSSSGMLERVGGRVLLRWTPPKESAGHRVWFQFMTLSPVGFLSTHAIEVTVGSG